MWRDYEAFLSELTAHFPHESKGIRAFYDECWRVFHPLNSIELKSLEEPRLVTDSILVRAAQVSNR